MRGAFCLEGALASADFDAARGDQDLVLWEVGPEDQTTRWAITLEGVPGTLTILQFFPVTSKPGQVPIVTEGMPLLEITATPDASAATGPEDVLLPAGEYIVGIARSGLVEGGERPTDAFRYRYRIEVGQPWPASADVEPNDDPSTAVSLTDAFEISGDAGGFGSDYYAWEVSETDQRWELAVNVPLGGDVSLALGTVDGQTIYSSSARTGVTIYDLALDAGTYQIRVPEAGDGSRPYRLRASVVAAEWDAEPNDQTPRALPIADGEAVRGRLAADADGDRYRLDVSAGERVLRDVRLIWRSGNERELCLLDETDVPLACRRGQGGATLANLDLPPASHTLEVRGLADPTDPYVLRVDTTSAPAPDFESEPNDRIASAMPLLPGLDIRARGGVGDIDFYHLRVDGEPQLWHVDVTGSGIRELSSLLPRGTALASGDIDMAGTSASLTDLYLVPGDHWFRVRADGPEYRLQAKPLGPPDPDGEREPNDTPGWAERYHIGTRRVGRLPTASDRDLYRFTLGAPQHLVLRLEQPRDGVVGILLWSGSELVASLRGSAPGEHVAYDLWLQPGDYRLDLEPVDPGEDHYELTSERLDPFALRVDQEPNDSPSWARPVPRSLEWTGDAADADDEDWYVLPPLASEGELRIRIDDEDSSIRLLHGDEQIELTRDDADLVASDPPLGVPLHLWITADEEYHVRAVGPGLQPVGEPIIPQLNLDWRLATGEVAAYWPEQQVIEAGLELTNEGPEDLEVALEAATSHYLWDVAVPESTVAVASGTGVSVPVTINVSADAWADEPVLVSARAVAPDGGQVSSSVEVAASVGAPPSRPRSGWTVPSELLGGLNVASLALGARPGGTMDLQGEAQLFDGVTPDGAGFHGVISQLPVELTVDLAGEGPLPVVGTILNPQGGSGFLNEIPRDFELLLSVDGITWESVLQDRLSPLPIDQSFVLAAPVAATHAKLRIGSVHADQPGGVRLGEWKVVAAPGAAPSPMPFDIADPAKGGHVVRILPFSGNEHIDTSVLDDAPVRKSVPIQEEAAFDLVIGFQDGRAAQVTSLAWWDPVGSLPGERVERLEVLVSTQTPVGPWRPLGSWELARAADGTVPPFPLETPTCVRYLRLAGPVPADARVLELPAEVDVLERTMNEEYRSILGEWGYRSARGPYEWLAPPEPVAPDPGHDAADERADAEPLPSGAIVVDRVEIGIDEDWYLIDVPEGHNTLAIEVGSPRFFGVRLSLFDVGGAERPMAFAPAVDGGVRYEAIVEPARRYALRVEQPPFSAVFAFDTSPSIEGFRETLMAGMRSFAADVQPGRESVLLLPFDERPVLDDWEDDPYLLQDAVVNHVEVGAGSSSVEIALIDASQRLMEREGARAILVVTDAQTGSYQETPELWKALEIVRPIIFSTHIGAAGDHVGPRQRMQDWAAAGGGHYVYPTTLGEMDRAFDRMATWLRRPASYSLSYTTAAVILEPGKLIVEAPTDEGQLGIAPGVGVEIILDSSGSMLKKLKGERRIDIAKASLRRLLAESLPEGIPVALRSFGATGGKKQARCGTTLDLPLGPLDRSAALRRVERIKAKKKTSTPIAGALRAVQEDLASVQGLRSVVLITDGAAQCGEDPAEAIAELRDAGVDVKLDIIGFALANADLKDQMAEWAEAGGGVYHDARDAEALAASIMAAVGAPFQVRGPDGERVASGTVGGKAVELDPGTYSVELLVDPPVTYRDVVVLGGGTVEIHLASDKKARQLDGTAQKT